MSDEYRFPTERLSVPNEGEECVILLSCGSFNPVTYAHFRLFETAKDVLQDKYKKRVVGGFISPCNDGYGKAGLINSTDRCEMVRLSLRDNTWITLDTWESKQPKGYIRTKDVLVHMVEECKKFFQDKFKFVRIMLLCGADLAKSMASGVWKHLDIILGEHGLVCMEREGVDLPETIKTSEILKKYEQNILTVPSLIRNDISSTKIREFVKKGYSTKYLTSDEVRHLIDQKGFYKE